VQQVGTRLCTVYTRTINGVKSVTVWDICTHASQLGQNVFEAHTSHSQRLRKFDELGHRLLESNSVFAHIIVAFFLHRNTRKILTLPENSMANRTQQSCETDSLKCLRTTLTSQPVFTSEHTTLYTGHQEAYLETESSMLSQKCFLGSIMAFIKHLFDITVTLNVCEGDNSQIPKQSPMFFFTCNSCDQSQ
jgi:hypothetical protein